MAQSTLTYSIDATDVLRKLRKAADLKPVVTMLNKAAIIAQGAAIKNAPKDTGELQRDIKYDVEVTKLHASIYTKKPYAPVMEFGRRAGATMPPPDALQGWMRRKGIPPEASFVLARSIARRGIKGRFFMQEGAKETKRELPRLIKQMAKDFEGDWKRG